MSWLSGLAGKAEDLLNKVDQQAAKTLHNPNDEDFNNISTSHETSAYSPFLSTQNDNKTHSTNSHMYTSASVPANLNKYTNQRVGSTSANATEENNHALKSANQRTHTPTHSVSPGARRKTKDRDQELFDFLNSDTPNDPQNRSLKPKVTAGLSRQSSSSSLASQRSNRGTEQPVMISVSSGTNGSNSGAENIQMTKEGSEEGEETAGNLAEDFEVTESSSGYPSTHESDEGVLSSLELENRLLKNEIASLNQEMSTVIQRSKTAQEDLNKMRDQQNRRSNQLSQSDQMIRELQSRESDLLESLKAKDSQLAVLRVRIEDVDKELEGKNKLLDTFRSEKERILADHTSSSDVHSQALDSLKDKLQETETLLQRERESTKTVQMEAMKQQNKFESDHQNLAESLSLAQRKLTDQKSRIPELNVQLKTAKSQLEAAKQDMIDYKEKAARILNSKDKLIASLKEGSGVQEDCGVSFAELEELRHEKEMMREELQQSKVSQQQLRTYLQETEIQLQTESEDAHQEMESLEEQLGIQKQLVADLQADNHRQKQELRHAHEELLKQKTFMQSRLDDRENEIERLRKQLMTKSVSSTSENELENRLHALTESLIHKQTMLEALSTEKNSLGLQLERLERQYKEEQAISARSHSHTVTMHDDDEVRQRLPGFLKESPTDSNVIRKVKQTAGFIDRFGISMGVFLRRYPVARVFVLLYIALLHLWVIFVMLTYHPEIHEIDYMLPREPRNYH